MPNPFEENRAQRIQSIENRVKAEGSIDRKTLEAQYAISWGATASTVRGYVRQLLDAGRLTENQDGELEAVTE